MFKLGRQRFVTGDGGPVIGKGLGFGAAKVDHRLDGEEHALFQHGAFAGAAFARRLPAVWLRRLVVAVGGVLSLIYFIKTYA